MCDAFRRTNLEIYTSGTKFLQNVWTENFYSTGKISVNTDTQTADRNFAAHLNSTDVDL
jgi:hypothetical protein